MLHPYAEELKVGLSAVRKAAAICQAVQEAITPDVLDKKDNSPVTVADFASQAVVCHSLSAVFPNDLVIAEEDALALYQPENELFLREIHSLIQNHYCTASHDEIRQWIDLGGANESSTRFWTLDPIDGTKGFLRRDQYAISLALIVNGQIELGILGCPNLEASCHCESSLFYAVRGQGAFSTRLAFGSEVRPLHVSSNSDLVSARFCESFESAHSSHSESSMIAARLGIVASPIRMDSQAKYAAVACGEADVYLRLPTKTGYFEKIWDHAGGVIIVQEAGGTVSDLSGKPLDFAQGRELRQNRGIIVTNGKFHGDVLSAAQAVALASQ